MTLKALAFAAPLVAFLATKTSAMEVTAGGSLEVQTNWSALKNLVDAANTRITTVHTDLNRVSSTVNDLKGSVSNLQGRMTNAEHSINGLNWNMDSVKNCGSSGYVFTGSGCRKTASNVSISTGSCFGPQVRNARRQTPNDYGPINQFYCPNGAFLSSATYNGGYIESFQCCYLNVSQ